MCGEAAISQANDAKVKGALEQSVGMPCLSYMTRDGINIMPYDMYVISVGYVL